MVEGRLLQQTRSETTSDRDRARVPLAPGPPVHVPPAAWSTVRAWTILDAFEAERHTLHLACGDRLDPYQVVAQARDAGHRPREVLSTSHVARAFTAAQLATLVHDRIAPYLRGAYAVTLSDPLAMLATDEVRFEKAQTILDDLFAALDGIDVPILLSQRRRDSPLFDRLDRATVAASRSVDGLKLPGGRVWWGPSRQTTLDAYHVEVPA